MRPLQKTVFKLRAKGKEASTFGGCWREKVLEEEKSLGKKLVSLAKSNACV